MSEMVERVARAMCLHDHGYDIWDDQAEMVREQYRLRIRAAIVEMRKPTQDMVVNYALWNKMIDEALK